MYTVTNFNILIITNIISSLSHRNTHGKHISWEQSINVCIVKLAGQIHSAQCIWNKQKRANVETGVHRRRTQTEIAQTCWCFFPIVHYRLWEGLAVCSAIKRPHRPHAQIVYYITVGFPPLTKHSPHDLSVPLNTNSSVSSLTGSCEWMMNCTRTKCCRPTQ